jgi:tripartite-type tricarboxylate transporter receptor subunit TctC
MKLFAIALAILFIVGTANADNFPSRPITIIVPYAAGGPSDVGARVFAKTFAKYLSQPVIIENLGGAAGNIAAAKVSGSRPDGYTLLYFSDDVMASSHLFYRAMAYDPVKDFQPLSFLTSTDLIVLGRPGLPANDLPSLTKYMKENNGKTSIGNSGLGAGSHLCQLLFLNAEHSTAISVPYRGLAVAINDLASETIDLLCDSVADAAPQIEAGRVKSFGVTSIARTPILPKEPTLDEQGLKGFDFSEWYCLFAPRQTPPDVASRLLSAVEKTLEDPDYYTALEKLGYVRIPAHYTGPAALSARFQEDLNRWGTIIHQAGIQPQ